MPLLVSTKPFCRAVKKPREKQQLLSLPEVWMIAAAGLSDR